MTDEYCPRCGSELIEEEFYGICRRCGEELKDKWPDQAPEVSYEEE